MLGIPHISNLGDHSALHALHLTANPDGVVSRERQLDLVIHFDGLMRGQPG